MNHLLELRHRWLWLSDLIVAALLGIILHLLVQHFHLKIGLKADLISLLLTALSAISFGAYVSFAAGAKSRRAQRLTHSVQYKNVLLTFLGYTTVIVVVFVVQLLFSGLKMTEFILALCAIAFYRFLWLFVKTIRLL